MQDFKCETDSIYPIMRKLLTIQGDLEENLSKAETVLHAIKCDKAWVGESALVGAAFLDLVVKYHSRLTGIEGDSPIMQAYEGMDEYIQANNSFYDEWAEYQAIKGI